MFRDDQTLLFELISDAVRSSAQSVCACGAVTLLPATAARAVMDGLKRVGLRVEGEPIPFNGGG